MKHTKEQIIPNVKKALEDIQFPYDEEKGVYYISFAEAEEPLRGPQKGQAIPAWTAWVEFGKNTFGPEPLFITVPDDTGEPLYVQHSTAVIELGIESSGKYYRK